MSTGTRNVAVAAPLGGIFAGCHTDTDGGHYVTLFRLPGVVHARHRLPGRGHGIVHDAHGARFVVLARRPGRFAVVIDAESGRIVDRFEAPDDRHFYGHGVFSGDGRFLYTTENDFDAGRGVVGVRDAARGFHRAGEFPSHGVGPHQIGLLPGGEALVVANGGIRTHPDSGRAKLNVDSMQSSLAIIDASDGALIDRAALDASLHKLSIRHIDVSPRGEVAIAMQHQGPKQDRVPLVAVWRSGRVVPCRAPQAVWKRMRQYTGSVAFDAGGRYLAVTCPRGNMATLWSAVSGRFLRAFDIDDGCGVAAHAEAGIFVATGSAGGCMRIDAASGRSRRLEGRVPGMWDNHLTRARSL
ncbi:MAG: DUF1513 domain-containing protein [Gammaproteobacteria bacterium]|nr:DUF1513 domain-containing protein [Gammaproteobacteria bacterium]